MRIEQLTFTRYLAALTVIFFHYGATVFPASVPWLQPLVTAGPIAVSYFYVLSGVIMAVAYYQPQQEQQYLHTYRYWLARFARIYPVYLLALLLMAAAKYQQVLTDPTGLVLSLSMLQAWSPEYALTLNTPGWSLSVEAFFYLSFPLIMLLFKRRHLPYWLGFTAAVWLATQLLHTYLLNSTDYTAHNALHKLIYYNPLMHWNTFLIGFLGGVWLREGGFKRFAQPAFNHGGLVLIGSLLAILLVGKAQWIKDSGVAFAYTNGLITPLFLLLIILLATNTSCISRWLQQRWLVVLGEASFSLYILQKPLHGIYERLMPTSIPADSALHFYLFVLLLTLSAIASYYLFETPLRRWINNFSTPPQQSCYNQAHSTATDIKTGK